MSCHGLYRHHTFLEAPTLSDIQLGLAEFCDDILRDSEEVGS